MMQMYRKSRYYCDGCSKELRGVSFITDGGDYCKECFANNPSPHCVRLEICGICGETPRYGHGPVYRNRVLQVADLLRRKDVLICSQEEAPAWVIAVLAVAAVQAGAETVSYSDPKEGINVIWSR